MLTTIRGPPRTLPPAQLEESETTSWRDDTMTAAERDWFRNDTEPHAEGSTNRCTVGASTSRPCFRPATVQDSEGEYALCAEHAQLEEIAHEINELGCAVELLEQWMWEARGHRNSRLEEGLCRLKNGHAERLRDAEFRLDMGHKLLNGERIEFSDYE